MDAHRAFEEIARRAAHCRECFALNDVIDTCVDVAQPRWVGEKYWSSGVRIVILMCNPGEGLKYPESTARLGAQLRGFRQGTETLATVVKNQRDASWSRFYVDGLRLDLAEIAFANLACCATKGNSYPRSVLDRCFAAHTDPLLRLLKPNIILAAGGDVQAFLRDGATLPTIAKVISVLHHAHRKGRKFERMQLPDVRRQLTKAPQKT